MGRKGLKAAGFLKANTEICGLLILWTYLSLYLIFFMAEKEKQFKQPVFSNFEYFSETVFLQHHGTITCHCNLDLFNVA